MPNNNPIRVFVVDDHQVVRMGLKTMLESTSDITVVGVTASAREALEQVQGIYHRPVGVAVHPVLKGGSLGVSVFC